MRFFVLLSLLISACAGSYQVPPGSTSAILTLEANMESQYHFVEVQAFGDRDCGKSPLGTRLTVFELRQKREARNIVHKKIPAGKEFVFSFTRVSPFSPKKCIVTGVFVPKANGRYKAVFEPALGGCTMEVYREEGDSGDATAKQIPEKTFEFNSQDCFNSIGG